jgi:hypothetical protein
MARPRTVASAAALLALALSGALVTQSAAAPALAEGPAARSLAAPALTGGPAARSPAAPALTGGPAARSLAAPALTGGPAARSLAASALARGALAYPAVTVSAPAIVFDRSLGGTGTDAARAIAVDGDGNVYATGETSSPDFPAVGGARRLAPGGGRTDAFVAKLDPAGRLVYSTLLGGEGFTAGHGIAVDRAGHAYVTGATNATDLPTTPGALQRSYGGGPFDAFVAALDATGKVRYTTFLGDTHYDEGNAIAVDRRGRAVIAGRTVSPQFPRAGRLRPPVAGGAFVAKLDRAGSKLVFSTVFGGSDRGNHGNTAFGVAVDRAGATYATGVTNAPAFPTVHPLQPALAGGGDAFAIKIDAAGRRVVYSTYLGGEADDSGRAIAADAGGDAYVTGVTSSTAFPAAAAPGGAADAFVAKLDPRGRSLAYGARIGGAANDDAIAIAVDAAGGAYVTGHTASPVFPLAPAAARSCGLGEYVALCATYSTRPAALSSSSPSAIAQAAAPGGGAFVARLARDGASLAFSTRLDGAASDAGLGIAVDRFGAVAVAGARGADGFVSVLAPTPLVGLRRQLVPRGHGTELRRLLRLGHAGLRFAAPSAGAVRVSWYAGRTRVAGGRTRFASGPGTSTVTMGLSRDGRHLLARADRVELTARGAFSPRGAAPVRATTTFALAH